MIGPAQRAILTVLAAHDGLTVTEAAGLAGTTHDVARRVAASLARKRYTVILGYRHTGWRSAAVLGATGTGHRALAAQQRAEAAS